MRKLAQTHSFHKDLVKFLKKHNDLSKKMEDVLNLLKKDVYSQLLRTHKLHGKLSKSYACDINYSYRIVFSFDSKYIYLESIGTHDEVY